MRPEHLNQHISKTLFLYGLFRHVMFRANVNVKSTQILYTCIPIESCLRKSLQRITLQLTYSPHKGAIYFLFATITVCLLCPLCFLCTVSKKSVDTVLVFSVFCLYLSKYLLNQHIKYTVRKVYFTPFERYQIRRVNVKIE